MTHSLESAYKELAKKRLYAQTSKQIAKDYREKLLSDQVLVDLEESAKKAEKEVEMLDQLVRESFLLVYDKSGCDKNVLPKGIGVRRTTNYVSDPKKVMEWALDKKMCLKVDDKAFKDICKQDSLRPEFVEVVVEDQITIATDLSFLLEE